MYFNDVVLNLCFFFFTIIRGLCLIFCNWLSDDFVFVRFGEIDDDI